MCQLVDWQIKDLAEKFSTVEPFDIRMLQPNTIDLKLGLNFSPPSHYPKGDAAPGWFERNEDGSMAWALPGGEMVLGHTQEVVNIPSHVCARIEGKSTFGRKGIMVHVSAGFIDSGFHGQITLELLNVSRRAVRLEVGTPIAQLSFHRNAGSPDKLYGNCGNHYQGQLGATPAAY